MTGNDTGADRPTASDAFRALGNETRTDVVRSLATSESASFTDLFEASDEETSAGFAYHLRQLDDRFVRSEDDEYELTHAGREVARAIRADTYTASVDRSPTAVDERCPICEERSLEAVVADNVTTVRCSACDLPVVRSSLPPSGYATREAEELPDAVDAHQRLRIRSFADGVCPDCSGNVSTVIEEVADDLDGDVDCDGAVEWNSTANGDSVAERNSPADRPLASFECTGCGQGLRCPVTLSVLDHPAVVSFYHDHGVDVSDRPVWNVGPEWREQFVSTDPLCVRVTSRLGEEPTTALHLYVGEGLTVVDHRRERLPDDAGTAPADGAAS